MLNPSGYGNASYYWTGLTSRGFPLQKLINLPNAQVEAGWLSGIIQDDLSPYSNLVGRVVVLYDYDPTNTNRFSPLPIVPLETVFVGLWGKNRAVFPHSKPSWRVWPPNQPRIT
jgi:hypothetical protein